MAKHLKGRIYKKVLRLICRYPVFVENTYKAYQFFVVHIPLLRSSYKWKMIRTRLLHFEVQRALFLKGKPCERNILFEVSFTSGRPLVTPPLRGGGTGSFTIDIAATGILVKGAGIPASARHAELLVDGTVLRIINLSPGKGLFVKIHPAVLKTFPVRAELRVRLDDGRFLAYADSDRVVVDAPFGTGELAGKLGQGHLLSKKGGMASSGARVREHQEAMLDLYSRVRATFERDIGMPLFLMYGTLLGYVRAGDFIPNDDDFDAGYVSRCHTAHEVKQETLGIMMKLLRTGFDISVNAVGRLFKISGGTGVHLDLMPAWFEGRWLVAYGGACVEAGEGDFLPVARGAMRGVEVDAPGKAERILEGYYGRTWRTPDPGYVTDFRQTGKDFRSEYRRFLLTPREYLNFRDRVELERRSHPSLGRLAATSLRGEV